MARALIGRTVRRLRTEQRLSQQALATRLGISASYLNLIEHDQRAVTASLADQAGRDAAGRSGDAVRPRRSASWRSACARRSPIRCWAPTRCRRRRSRNWPPSRRTPPARCWRCIAPGAWRARMPAASRCPPAGGSCCRTRKRATSSTTRGNHFPALEAAAEAIGARTARGARRDEPRHRRAAAPRAWADGDGAAAGRRAAPLRSGGAQPGAVGDAAAREPGLPHGVPARAAGGARGGGGGAGRRRAVVAGGRHADPRRPAELRRGGAADAVCGRSSTRRGRCATTWRRWRRVSACRSSRRAIGCRRCSGTGARGVPFFFVRVDPAGNVSKRFSAAGFPFARYRRLVPALGGAHRVRARRARCGCRWRNCRTARRSVLRAHGDAAVARAGASRGRCMWWRWAAAWRTPGTWPTPTASTCERAKVGIGLSCRLCDRPDCRSRAFPPLEHRLALDPNSAGVTPYRFEARRG